jgi:hypothetical protein
MFEVTYQPLTSHESQCLRKLSCNNQLEVSGDFLNEDDFIERMRNPKESRPITPANSTKSDLLLRNRKESSEQDAQPLEDSIDSNYRFDFGQVDLGNLAPSKWIPGNPAQLEIQKEAELLVQEATQQIKVEPLPLKAQIFNEPSVPLEQVTPQSTSRTSNSGGSSTQLLRDIIQAQILPSPQQINDFEYLRNPQYPEQKRESLRLSAAFSQPRNPTIRGTEGSKIYTYTVTDYEDRGTLEQSSFILGTDLGEEELRGKCDRFSNEPYQEEQNLIRISEGKRGNDSLTLSAECQPGERVSTVSSTNTEEHKNFLKEIENAVNFTSQLTQGD